MQLVVVEAVSSECGCDPGSIRDSIAAWEVRGAGYSKCSGRAMLETRQRIIRRKMGGGGGVPRIEWS